MIIGLVAPEIVLYIAFDQYLEARFIARELAALKEKRSDPDYKSV